MRQAEVDDGAHHDLLCSIRLFPYRRCLYRLSDRQKRRLRLVQERRLVEHAGRRAGLPESEGRSGAQVGLAQRARTRTILQLGDLTPERQNAATVGVAHDGDGGALLPVPQGEADMDVALAPYLSFRDKLGVQGGEAPERRGGGVD